MSAGPIVIAPSAQSDELSLAEILRVLYRRKWIIVVTTLIIFSMAAIYSFLQPSIYESSATLQIDPNRTAEMGMQDLLSGIFSDNDRMIGSEIKVMESDTVAAMAVKEMKLVKSPDFMKEEEDAKSLPDDPAQMTPGQRRMVLSVVQGGLAIKAIPNTNLVSLKYRHHDPKFAADVLNALIRAYIERAFVSRHEGAAMVGNWLSGQMADLQKETESAQHKLADFQKLHGILGADEENNIIVDRLKQVNQQLTDAEADRIVKEAHYRIAATGDPELMVSIAPASLQNLRMQQADLRLQLAQLRSKYGAGYPKVGETEAQLRKLDIDVASEVSNITKRMKGEFDTASRTEAMIRGQFEDQKREAYKLNENAAEYAILRHEVESTATLYDTLQLKLKGADVSSGLSASFISVVDPADVPIAPVLPKRSMTMLLGLFGGGILGCVLSFLRESLDDTLSRSEELELCTTLPVLCSVPISHPQSRPKAELGETEKAVPLAPMLLDSPRSQAAEAFRGLRTSILLSSPEQQPKVIVIASSLAAEGKTTVSTNLSISFAQRGESVLLIDADLHRSSILAQFGLPHSRYGLSTALTQGINDRTIATPLESLPNFKILPAGPHPPNPAELLGSKRTAELLETLSGEYDRIIIDTPPILSVSDALALANLADAVVLVVRSGVARKKAVLRVRDLLQRANSNVVGIVFNCVNLQLENYYTAQAYGYSKTMHHYYVDEEG
jgi:capsular exopolysaccharide synthesis family protein